jgi:hypothetical protein
MIDRDGFCREYARLQTAAGRRIRPVAIFLEADMSLG